MQAINLFLFVFSFHYLIKTSLSQSSWKRVCSCILEDPDLKYCDKWECIRKVNYDDNYCFPQTAYVTVSIKHDQLGHQPISTFQIGQNILSVNNEMKVINDEYLGFIHILEQKKVNFKRIDYRSDCSNSTNHILISDEHLMLGKEGFKRAKHFNVGDLIYQENCVKDGLIPTKIESVSYEIAKGFYAPLTRSGTLFVNGIVVSNYANINSHYLADMAFKPLKYLYYITPNNLKTSLMKTDDSTGYHWYARFLMKISYYLRYEEA